MSIPEFLAKHARAYCLFARSIRSFARSLSRSTKPHGVNVSPSIIGLTLISQGRGADGKLVAGRITERVSLATPKYETRDVATCAEVHKSSATAVSFDAECCCLVTPSKTVVEELSTARTCDDICKDKGMRCEGRGTIDFARADGTTCSTTLACNESRPPTATCGQKPSVGAVQTCTCR